MLLLDERVGAIVDVPARRRDRAAARLHAASLDRRLAAGESPDSSLMLALRARKLTGRRDRRALAAGIQRVLHEAARPANLYALPFDWPRIRLLTDELAALRDVLADGGLVDPRGVAMVQLLLTDGGGPLHRPGGPVRLRDAIDDAVYALRPPQTGANADKMR